MHLHLPIEQLVQRVGTAFQFGFATEAKELLPEKEEFLLNASHRGLHVLARNEEVRAFYEAQGYAADEVVSYGKRLT